MKAKNCLLVLVSASILLACGSGAKYIVQGTEQSIGVDGTVTIKPELEDVNSVEVELINLPPPERHDASKRVFVVWITPPNGTPVRAGTLSYSPKNRRGYLKVTTPNDNVTVDVTAEHQSQVERPSDLVVLHKYIELEPRDGSGQ